MCRPFFFTPPPPAVLPDEETRRSKHAMSADRHFMYEKSPIIAFCSEVFFDRRRGVICLRLYHRHRLKSLTVHFHNVAI